jgi:hypothetical protein
MIKRIPGLGLACLWAGCSAPHVTVVWDTPELCAELDAGGLRFRGPDAGVDEIGLALGSWGRDGAMVVSAGVRPQRVRLDRAEFARGGLVEWWEDRPAGLEHGFTVYDRPTGDGPLIFELMVVGAPVQVSADGTSAAFGVTARYTRLLAWDQRGEPLPAWMEETGDGLRILVDDDAAVGIVTVDPLLNLGWTAESDQVLALFGTSVAPAGDVNGDGYDDVLVGAPFYDNGEADEGRVWLYLGSPLGLEPIPAWAAESDQADALMGHSVASAGDVNGDGFDDVVVGAYQYTAGEPEEGRAYVYHGSPAGLEIFPAWTAESDLDSAWFGESVATAGDVNGDGYDDVIVGAWAYDTGRNEGHAYLFLGSPGGLDTAAAWTSESAQANTSFGTVVATAGDVNADGYDDVLVGAPTYDTVQPDDGQVFLYLGSAFGLAPTPAWSVASDQSFASFGDSVAAAGDVNADGYDDVVIGAECYDNGDPCEGRAYLYLGGPGGLAPTPVWMAESDQGVAQFGCSVAGAGDLNGDGYADVVVGAYQFGEFGNGRVYAFLGGVTALPATPSWARLSDQGSSHFGWSVAIAGDVDRDGFDDMVVGAPLYDNPQSAEGMAFLYRGACDDPVDSDGDGTGNRCDRCPGFDDLADLDGDGAPDACDACPGFDDEADGDGDGVPNSCDGCPDAFDALQLDTDGDGIGNACDPCGVATDGDGDGVPDDCDLCLDGDDGLDADLDGVADACDQCPGADDTLDNDGDTVPNACDLCPGFEDQPDADRDLVADGCDRCPGFADTDDGDGDLEPDACDVCPSAPDPEQRDGDGDGVGDACDVCPGYDDRRDADLDMVPDACDLCPGEDDLADGDLDLVPDGCDVCMGFDDAIDADLDLTPDGCDACPSEAGGPDLDLDGFATCTGDCWEGNPLVFPGATEAANGIDDDCDRVVDEGTVWFDDDGDGATEEGGDCDDADASRGPGALETCDAVDQDCDDAVDEDTECSDDDGDGFTELAGDCADGDALVFPGALELLDNRIDDDCDGEVDPGHWDPDGDGVEVGDCAPADPSVYPGRSEVENGIDDNCDGRIDEGTAGFDDDGDGVSGEEGDCNDGAADIVPGAIETPDGRDENCNTQIDEGTSRFDDDGDGQTEEAGDCNDADALVQPGAAERANGVDDDCDGAVDEGTDDRDADGWTTAQGDCNDENGWMNPEQIEVCDTLDNDCDGEIDDACTAPLVPSRLDPPIRSSSTGCDHGVPVAPFGALALVPWLRRRRVLHARFYRHDASLDTQTRMKENR